MFSGDDDEEEFSGDTSDRHLKITAEDCFLSYSGRGVQVTIFTK
jgi:hypothetical protein